MKEKNNEGKILLPKESQEESPGNIQDLRSKTLTPKSDSDFKKVLFGGYDDKEVNDYIRSINNQHNRTISAYQERIDEFTTFIEMLNREKEDIIKNYRNNDDELEELKEKCINYENQAVSYKEEITKLQDGNIIYENDVDKYKQEIVILKEKFNNYENDLNSYKEEITRLNSEISNIKAEHAEKMKELESEFGISKENEFLKKELNVLSISRDKMQSENSIIRAELESSKDDIDKTRGENKKLRDEIALLNSQMRKYRMSQNMKIIEFSEREIFMLKKAGETLNNLIEDIGKLTEDTINFKQSSGEEIEE